MASNSNTPSSYKLSERTGNLTALGKLCNRKVYTRIGVRGLIILNVFFVLI